MKTEHQEAIGKKFAAFRKAKGMSQKELAKDICSPSSISQMESGIFVLSAGILQQLCDRLEIRMEDLIEGYQAELEAPLILDIIKIHIELEKYDAAMQRVEELSQRGDLDEEVNRNLSLARAECLMRTGRTKAALEILTELQQELEKKRDSDDHLMATLYNKLGTAYFFDQNISKAYAHYHRAYMISLKFPVIDDLAARIAFNLGKVCSWMKNNIDAQEFFTIAEQFFNKSTQTKELASILYAQGLVYLDRKDLTRAEESLKESLTLYKSLNMYRMAQRVKRAIACLILSQTQPDLAVLELAKCAEMFESMNDEPRAAFSYAAIAEIYLDQRQYHQAKHYLQLSFNFIFEDTLVDPKYAYVYRIQARYLLAVGLSEESIEFSFKSSELFDRMGMAREAADSLELSIDAYRSLGKVDQALDISVRVSQLLRNSLDMSFYKTRGIEQ